MYKTQTRLYQPGLGRFTQSDPAKAGNNWYAYCGGDPVNKYDPSGLRAIVANDAMDEFNKWWGQHMSPALNQKFSYIFPQGNEGVSLNWTGGYSSSFSELWFNGGVNLEGLPENEMTMLAMVMDPDHTYVFDKNGWREKSEADVPNAIIRGMRAADSGINAAGEFTGAVVMTGLYYAGKAAEPLQALPPQMGGGVGRIGAGVRIATAAARFGQAAMTFARWSETVLKVPGVTRALARTQQSGFMGALRNGFRPVVTKSVDKALAGTDTFGYFQPDAPLMLQRSGFLGKLGIKAPVYTGGRIARKPGLSAADNAMVDSHEFPHVAWAFRNPELKYLQSKVLPGRGFSAFFDELSAYRASHGGFQPGMAWRSMNFLDMADVIVTPLAVGGAGYWAFDSWSNMASEPAEPDGGE